MYMGFKIHDTQLYLASPPAARDSAVRLVPAAAKAAWPGNIYMMPLGSRDGGLSCLDRVSLLEDAEGAPILYGLGRSGRIAAPSLGGDGVRANSDGGGVGG